MTAQCLTKGHALWRLSILTIFLLLTMFPVHPTGSFAASGGESGAEIAEGAKKEGKVVFYTTSSLEVGRKMLDQFRAKYPFMQTDIYRTGSQGMLTKVLAEMQAKKNFCDVVMTPGGEGMTLKRKGFYAKYVSPESKLFPDGFKDPEGYWTDNYTTMNAIVYNTKLVSPQEVPQSWNDLLNPRWKGKIGIDTKSFEWFGYMLKIMGQKSGLEFMQKLSEQHLQFNNGGRTLMVQLVAAGEIHLALVYREDVELTKDKGASVDWVGFEPIIPSIHPIGINAHAPHPNAAKLFIDFSLSREGQETWVRLYRVPSRPDIKPLRLKKVPNVLTPDFAIIGDYEKYGKLYREVLMKK